MFGVLLDVLKETAQRSGLLDSCDATGYSVCRRPDEDGSFAVSSTAAQGFRGAELRSLAATLLADGYQVRMCRNGSEPLLMVRAE